MMDKLDYRAWLKVLLGYVMRFRNIIVGGTVIVVLSVSILRINQHSSIELNQERYDEELVTIRGVKFDEETVQKILDLKDLNIDIKSIFPDDRNNPFQQ